MFEKGIFKVRHLVKDDGTLVTLEELERKFEIKIPFTVYYGLINTIPNGWLTMVRDTENMDQSKIPLIYRFPEKKGLV